jgi:hypothetical protein
MRWIQAKYVNKQALRERFMLRHEYKPIVALTCSRAAADRSGHRQASIGTACSAFYVSALTMTTMMRMRIAA